MEQVNLEMAMAADLMSEQGKVWRIGDIVEREDAARAGLARPAPGRQGWYIVYVAGGDGRAVHALERRGWSVYRPMMTRYVAVKKRGGLRADRTLSRKKRREQPALQRITVPLYPRYLFVAADPRLGAWWMLLDIPGVAAVIRHGSSVVVRLDNDVIDGIRSEELSGEHDERQPANLLKPLPNAMVRIVKGPFAGFSGTVVEGGDPDTVRCEVGVFGGTTPVSMPLDHVEIA
ncbi:transcription termination/antitermination protein NusG [Kaistia sp. MMO-174]|uniref:transcription termination/antitermination protein NusG n=1 Tax=Kaistia sp. MMO-174 TaxID=3081256 RepID=UPI003018D246